MSAANRYKADIMRSFPLSFFVVSTLLATRIRSNFVSVAGSRRISWRMFLRSAFNASRHPRNLVGIGRLTPLGRCRNLRCCLWHRLVVSNAELSQASYRCRFKNITSRVTLWNFARKSSHASSFLLRDNLVFEWIIPYIISGWPGSSKTMSVSAGSPLILIRRNLLPVDFFNFGNHSRKLVGIFSGTEYET